MAGFFNIDDQGNQLLTPQSLDRKRQMAEAMIKQGNDFSPVQSWTQGAARLANALIGGYKENQLDTQEASSRKSANESLIKLLSGIDPSTSGAGALPAAAATAAAPAVAKGGFDASVNRTLGFEGGLNPADTNGTPSKFGINQQANPDVNLASLDQNGAKSIYKSKYWDAIGGDNLPPALAHVAFDTAVIAGPGKAQQLMAQSGGDPNKLLDLREQFQNQLLASDPAKYGKYGPAWNNRVNALRADISQGAPAAPGASAFAPTQAGGPPAPGVAAINGASAPTASASPQMGVLQNTPPSQAPSPASAPTASAAMPAPQQTPNMVAALAKIMSNPWLGDSEKSLAMALVKDKMGPQYDFQAVGDQLYRTNKRTGEATPYASADKPMALGSDQRLVRGGQVLVDSTKPTANYSVIGEDQFGNKQYGWIDPTTRTIVPGSQPSASPQPTQPPPQAAPGQSPTGGAVLGVPPAPPGADPKAWRAEKTKELATGGPKMSENEANANAFSSRMEEANKIINSHESEGTSRINQAAGYVPLVGNSLVGEGAQQYNQAKRAFVNSVLRKESGASISPSEFVSAEKQYFPQPGDSQKVIEQKRAARQTAIDGMKVAAGKAGANVAPQPKPAPSTSGNDYSHLWGG